MVLESMNYQEYCDYNYQREEDGLDVRLYLEDGTSLDGYIIQDNIKEFNGFINKY